MYPRHGTSVVSGDPLARMTCTAIDGSMDKGRKQLACFMKVMKDWRIIKKDD